MLRSKKEKTISKEEYKWIACPEQKKYLDIQYLADDRFTHPKFGNLHVVFELLQRTVRQFTEQWNTAVCANDCE